ncbi:MAG: Processing protease [Candidatus Collierbacteria bacterium GW2011_GWA2_42_17]|uniref:Processing protease n=1 Tax=Candidatus Collierbacteria bacterium GW2011_GWA2_42_17 TaxID=1618378 RepID=A0A0G1BA82_9BACT|nr:MAG: Processing protease [Candidatus Collierbacteria bacterium GW2011_GWA2_42_17]KKS62203.1 MAG: Processing protease [Candidatus Collierbacteria bacterium GW2011_GWF1_42_50]KKS62226.1 MAG: Processing protease [Candidatus Collierbacteria bacterium GW2011_GWD2_42_50]KKS64204.1 MAG: Processing protease [Candidatus Collierbacteria bacterium GW2011_GWF2_42_51]
MLVPEERESVTVRVMIGTGSREETDKEAGSAHFLEHFVFKGTRKFPRMFDINEAVEKVGGAFNAYTGQNEMGFWVKMDKGHVALATEIVGQVVTEPVLPKEHFNKERGTILEELHMYEDRPNSKAAEECEKLLYGKTNMGRPIIGTVESLEAMTVEELRKYFEKWFVAENIVLGVVGEYGSDESMLELIKKEFGPLIDDSRTLSKKDKFSWDVQKKPRIKLVSRKVEQAAVYVAFRGIKMTDERRFTLELLNIIYGDGWMSRLMREVREERGWAYAIGSGVEEFSDAGSVMVGAGLPKNKLNEAVELITEISVGLAGGNVWAIKDGELEIAKDCFRGRLALAFDKPEEVLGSALEDTLFREKIYSPEEIMEKIESVSMEDIRSLAAEIFKKENMSIAVVGDYKKLDFNI